DVELQARRPDELVDELRRRAEVVVTKRDRDRPLELRIERRHPGRRGRAPGERVLDHAVLDVAAAQLAAQLLDLADRQAAIVRQDRDLRLLEFFREELDLLGLLLLACSRQIKNPPCQTSKAGMIKSFTYELPR